MVPNKEDANKKTPAQGSSNQQEEAPKKIIVDADLDADDEEKNEASVDQGLEKIQELKAIIKKKDKEIADLQDDLKWNRADFENYRKTMEKRMDSDRLHLRAKGLKDFLSFFDSFDQAIQLSSLLLEKDDLPKEVNTFLKGLMGLNKNLNGILKSKNLKRIDALGEKFDYNLHEVTMSIEDENLEEDTVVKEVQKGWLLDGKVLRPTMVAVSKKPPEKEGKKSSELEKKDEKPSEPEKEGEEPPEPEEE